MTDEEFMELFDALTERNRVILLDLMDKLLTEQLGEQVEKTACFVKGARLYGCAPFGVG